MLARVASSAVLIPTVIAVLYLGGAALLALVLAVVVLCCHEFTAIFREGGHRPPLLPMTTLAVAIAFTYHDRSDLLPVVVVAGTAGMLLNALINDRPPLSLVFDASLGLLGALYIGGFMSYALLLRGLPYGFQWTLAALICTWAADTGAFIVGRRFGRRKLCPRLSPGKTWEGAIGGLTMAVIAGLLAVIMLPALSVPLALAFGMIVALAAVAGDLIESLLKRAAGVKDSGSIIPGHGGVLDRVDSLLLVLPVAYLFALFVQY